MAKKLHMGCGTIFLDGWLNVDIQGPGVCLASERPDLVELYKTTEENYYARHANGCIEEWRKGAKTREEVKYVCDVYGSLERIPAGNGEVEELLCRQVWEHMSLSEARRALDELDRVMAPGGIVRIDVPDWDSSLDELAKGGDTQFFKRHLLGPRSTPHGYHTVAYARETLKGLIEEVGLIFEAEEPNIHPYPAFCLRFRKPGPRPAWQYFDIGARVKEGWNCLEIGPGTSPWPRANVYVDYTNDILDKLVLRDGQKKVQGNLDERLPFNDKEFDFVYAAHVLEHVQYPVKAAREISRIAKRGIVIVPSMWKDFLFNWDEGTHRWWFMRSCRPGDPMRCFPVDYQFRSDTSDSNVSSALCRLFKSGPNRLDYDARLLRKWFYQREPFLDVIEAWEGSFTINVLE